MKRRMTLIDLLALILIVCEIVFLCIEGYDLMSIHVRRGNDANYVNTCESVAKVNRLNGIHCSVDGCLNANEDCVHHHSNGYIDYFDSVSNSIVAHKTKGYNSCKNPEVQGKEYSGNAGEMILEVIVKDGTISVQWTGGKQ